MISPDDKQSMKFIHEPRTNGHGRAGNATCPSHAGLHRKRHVVENQRRVINRFDGFLAAGTRDREELTAMFGRQYGGNLGLIGGTERHGEASAGTEDGALGSAALLLRACRVGDVSLIRAGSSGNPSGRS